MPLLYPRSRYRPFSWARRRSLLGSFASTVVFLAGLVIRPVQAQSPSGGERREAFSVPDTERSVGSFTQSGDPLQGTSVAELVHLALERNAELLAVRQRAPEAQGLLRQAGFRPSPGFDMSLTSGSFLGSPGERELEVGYAHTVELGGKRGRRVAVARLAIDLTQLDVADRERQLKAELQGRYGEALAAARNLDIAERLLALNQQHYRMTEAQVHEGEAASLEQGLLQVEVSRIEADRLLFENQVVRALLELKTLAGMNLDESLRLSGDLVTPRGTVSLDEATARALAERPDLKAARLAETIGEEDMRLVRAEAIPNVIGFARYARVHSRFDQFGLGPRGDLQPIRDLDNVVTAGVSITLPIRNRNQGNIQAARARREAARLRREFVEQAVWHDVRAAYSRYEAARRALEIFDQRIIGQSQDNLRIIRAAYSLGELRVLDVINEQRRLIETQKAYTEVLKESYLALVELERAIGGPLR